MSPENNKQSGASPLLRELTPIIILEISSQILNSAVLISGESPDKASNRVCRLCFVVFNTRCTSTINLFFSGFLNFPEVFD